MIRHDHFVGARQQPAFCRDQRDVLLHHAARAHCGGAHDQARRVKARQGILAGRDQIDILFAKHRARWHQHTRAGPG
jgi:hypothetical protein